MPDTNNQEDASALKMEKRPVVDPYLGAAMIRGDFLTSATADIAWTLIASRFARGRMSTVLRSTPMESFLTSSLIGLSVILIRELVVSPLTLKNKTESMPRLQERQDLYAIERRVQTLGDKHARDLTKDLHEANDRQWLDRVWETGVAGLFVSFVAPVVIGVRSHRTAGAFVRNLPVRLGYGATMMMGQLLYNDMSRRAYQVEAHFFHSQPRSARELDGIITQKLASNGTLEELHRGLKLERLQDNMIQVQRELSVVRWALALNGTQK